MDEAALKAILESLTGQPDVEEPSSHTQRKVISFLQSQAEFEGNLMLSHFGNGWMSAAHALSYPLLQIAKNGSSDAAARWLRQALSLSEATTLRVLPLWGIEISAAVQLGENIWLLPFDQLPPSDNQRALGSPRFMFGQPSFR